MKHYTPEQLEQALQHSQRAEQPLSSDHKQTFLEGLFVQPSPWYRRFWQIWLAVPLAGAAMAGVIWYFNVRVPATTQLANGNANLPIELPINTNNSNLIISENSNQSTSSNTNENDNTNAEMLVRALEPRSNLIDERFYHGLGGGAEHDYNAIQFTEPALFTPLAAADLKQRATLGKPELVQLAKLFDVPAEYQYLELLVYGATETSCAQSFLQTATESCLNLNAAGMVHYLAADSTRLTLADTTQLLSKLTGLSAAQYVTQQLTDVEGSVATYQHYHIYYSDSLTSTGLIYRDLGWDVYLRGGELHSLRGYLLPEMESTDSVQLITPTEALSRLRAGFQPLDLATNPNTGRIHFSQMYLEDLLRANSAPTLTLKDLSLEYLYGISDSQLSLMPVYYLRATDAATGQSLDLYIDATETGTLCRAYEVIAL